ncbi:MAG: MBL fold metallo-hydrolase [Clostridia bacterium]|jgi:L-ascorbate metabolism protein UlaG (beta-lactamase superfamily)|nr:MBL fold metallo-hydrolase [Clostridia bacterium]
MVIRQIHHAEFLIETESGFRIATDPYDSSCGYPVEQVKADAVLVSHAHRDHNAVENISGNPAVISEEGSFSPDPMIRITAISGYHDDEEGRKRGTTLLFLIEAEGLRVVHLGDLGCALNEEQIRKLFRPDILMVPVGGFFTIDGKQAAETAKILEARTVLPMHYKTQYISGWPISGPEDFLNAYSGKTVLQDAEALRVTSGDMECHPQTVLFRQ